MATDTDTAPLWRKSYGDVSNSNLWTGGDKGHRAVAHPRLRLRWHTPTDGPIYSSPVVGPWHRGARLVFALAVRGTLYAVSERDGKRVWEAELRRSDGATAGCAVGPDNTLYVGSGGDMLTAFEATSGRRLWRFASRVSGSEFCAPALGPDGTVYVGSLDHYVYAVDGRTGKKKWEFKTGGYVDFTPALSPAKNLLFVGSRDGNLYCLDCGTGKERWRHSTPAIIGWRGPIPRSIVCAPVITPEGSVIAATEVNIGGPSDLFALALDSGRLLWKVLIDKSYPVPLALDAGRGIYVGTRDGSVISLDRRTGRKRWEHNEFAATGGTGDYVPCVRGVVVSAETSLVYVQDGIPLYALDTERGGKRQSMGRLTPVEENASIPQTPLALSTGGLILYGFGISDCGLAAVSAEG